MIYTSQYKLIEEIVEKQITNSGKTNYYYYVIVETKYGLCKLRKDQFIKNKKLTRQCAINPTEFFQNESNERHNFEFEILSPYIKNDTYISIKHKICNNIFSQSPSSHLRGKGCPTCAGFNRSFNDAIKKANNVHNNFYKYIEKISNGSRSKIKIICPVHGEFNQRIDLHLKGHGCSKCAKQNTGWSRSNFISRCGKNNEGLGIFYIIKCFNENEEFYKLGITSKSIKTRYNTKKLMPYKYEIIQEIIGESVLIFDLEKYLKKQIHSMNLNINPLIYFPGSSTECYSYSSQKL